MTSRACTGEADRRVLSSGQQTVSSVLRNVNTGGAERGQVVAASRTRDVRGVRRLHTLPTRRVAATPHRKFDGFAGIFLLNGREQVLHLDGVR